jgi:hypothetical protein
MTYFWTDVFPYPSSIGYYYTYFSFYLFLVSFLIPGSYQLKWIILFNTIVVGLAGNFIYEYYSEQHNGDLSALYPNLTTNEIIQSSIRTNLFHHTLPLVISLFLFLQCPQLYFSQLPWWMGTIALFFIIWAIIPYNGQIGAQKIQTDYQYNVTILSVVSACIIIVLFSLVVYLQQ